MLFLLLIYAVLTLWAYTAYKENLNRGKQPPVFDHSLPIFGHSLNFIGGNNSHFLLVVETAFSEVLKRGGGVVRAMIGFYPFYVITDPEDCYTVANTCLSKPPLPYSYFSTYLGSGIFSQMDGHAWKPRRKLLNPAFSQHMLDEFLKVFNEETRLHMLKLKKHVSAGPFDQTILLQELTLETIIRTALDISEEDNEKKKYIIEDSTRLLELAGLRITNLWFYFDFIYRLTALGSEEKMRYKRLSMITEEIINKKKMQRLNTTNQNDNKYKPVLDILLQLEDDGALTRKDVMDEINTIIAAGFHTSAVALSFILCVVGTYPKVQDRIYEELLKVFGTSDRDVEKNDLANLVYLEAVIKETLRLYPIGPIIARYGEKAVKLKDYTIPKNSFYVLLLNATMRLPIWGDDKDNFRPERWLEPASIPENPNAFTSFSVGKRACIGRTYSIYFLKVACAHIFRQYKIKGNIHKIQLRLDIFYTFHSGQEIEIENRK